MSAVQLAYRSPIAALPDQDPRQDFLSLYRRREIFIYKVPGQERWTKANGPLLDNQILGVISDEGRGVLRGCYWSQETRHGVLDIDVDSKYHSVQGLEKLRADLAGVSLAANLYQSSESTGWHLYIPFSDWAESSDVEKTLKEWLKAKGYDIKCGQLEVFPSGQALRLPLQRGFAWLDDQGAIKLRREDIKEEQAIKLFLDDLGKNARDWLTSKRLITTELEAIRVSGGDGRPGQQERASIEGLEDLFNYKEIPERIEEARRILLEGLTEPGQRHSAVLSLEHLLWFGDPERGIPRLPGTRNNAKRHRFVMELLQEKHNGFCNHINREQWQKVDEQVRRACEWRRSNHAGAAEYEPYKVTEKLVDLLMALSKATGRLWTVADLERANNKREFEAIEKIRAAVHLLTEAGKKPTIKGLARLTRCHRDTIRRHAHIWMISPAVALSKGPGHIEPGGMGGQLAILSSVPVGSEKEDLYILTDDADSGDLELDREDLARESETQADWDVLEQEAALQAVAPPSPPLAAAWLRLVADETKQPCELAPISLWCLTPYAETLRGDGEQLNGKSHLRLLPPSDPASLATGSSTGALTCRSEPFSTCGLNGFPPTLCAGPSHLNPRGIFCKGARVLNLTASGGGRERSRGPPVT